MDKYQTIPQCFRSLTNFLVYGIEMSYVNVYLLSLGMTKSLNSIVWLAGPLSGLIVQPMIGILSDNSTNKYGRRRPYMLIGSVCVSIALITMAWAEEIVGVFPFSAEMVCFLLTLETKEGVGQFY